MTAKKKSGKGNFKQAKIATRLLAVQALYAQDVTTGTLAANLTDDLDKLVESVMDVLGAEHALDDALLKGIDRTLLHRLINGVVADIKELDSIINPYLKKSGSVTKLTAVLRAVLRAATYEMKHMEDVKAKSIIDSYVEVTKAFYDQKEAGFVNGLLDALAKTVRPKEMKSGE
ncbi:MAG: transcription antitermination factor NusB [Proteobacteria bacterium]|nr:transcription antitermination factor NusB [Pseudomonadota bacterium]